MKTRGFTIIEMLIALAVIGFLLTLSFPIYKSHVIRVRRAEAKVALVNLSLSLEQYYQENNSYLGVTLEKLSFAKNVGGNSYFLQINSLSSDQYQISARAFGSQAKGDTKCGDLSLDQRGVKAVSGDGSIDECWG